MKKCLSLREEKRRFKIQVVQMWCKIGKEKRYPLCYQANSALICGMDGTRTRDPLRDRQVF